MKNSRCSKALIVLGLVALTACSFAIGGLEGKWIGKTKSEGISGPVMTPTMRLELLKEGKFKMIQEMPNGEKAEVLGNWKSDDKSVTLIVKRVRGKDVPADKQTPRVYELGKDGKSFSRDMSGSFKASLVQKGAEGNKTEKDISDKVKMILTFTRDK